MTYKNFFRWVLKGIGVIILFFLWTMWKHLFLALPSALGACFQFVWTLIKFIHSKKRVLCALDGTTGGVIALLYFSPVEENLAAKIFVIVCGGLLGAAFGCIHEKVFGLFCPKECV